jgi:UDP-glucose 4-epimerase
VGSQVGAELASRLERDPEFEYVAGLDVRRPPVRLEQTDLIEADIRSPLLVKLLPQTGVDTVVHNGIVRQAGRGMSASQAHDVNVIGSLQLLAACERAPTVRNIVIRGSAGIYGSEPNAPQFFTEEMMRLYPLRSRFQRDISEIEKYFETYSRRHPDVTCMMLRFQPAIGPSVDSQVTRYMSLPVVPTYLGFDPRLQFVHERDALDALVASVKRPLRGAVNVAGPGTIGLTRMLRIAGKLSLPLAPGLFGPVTGAAKGLGLLSLSPDFERLLHYGRGVDVSRLLEELDFRPRFGTADAVEEFAATLRGRRVVPASRPAVRPS